MVVEALPEAAGALEEEVEAVVEEVVEAEDAEEVSKSNDRSTNRAHAFTDPSYVGAVIL